MPKTAIIQIQESDEELKSLLRETKNLRLKIRIQSLILTKEKKFQRREDLAEYLGVGTSSLYRWTEVYKKAGIDAMLKISNGGKRRNAVPSEVHIGLEKKLGDSENPFLGYWDAQIWVKENYGIDLKYVTLRSYMIRNFGTKLKTPRKSHYKKDEQAIEAFKKTT